ncbi:MAG TPA: fimbria/pilus periplasmic chaperone [Pseudomonadales bacterium]|nr:fimbria/pilus periplasmic chaperone [Pseudomonadales bacterium]
MPALHVRVRTLCLSALLCTFVSAANADMVLDRSILVFDADAGRQDVEVTNTGDDNLYLNTEILTVRDPGTQQEARVSVEDPDAVGVLVTPARMVVPPGGRQLVRIVLLEEPAATDRIFRINLVPVVAPLEAEATAVKVIVAYQLLVIVRPENPQPQLEWTRDGTRITFANSGNSNVLLYGGIQCPPGTEPGGEGGAACVELGVARRLYAGNSWTLELPFDAPVDFTTTVGVENVRRRFE